MQSFREACSRGTRELRRLGLQVPEVGLGVEAAADDALERLLRRELAAVAPEPVAQPRRERLQPALLDVGVEGREVLPESLPDLERDHVAERVRGEVADRAA